MIYHFWGGDVEEWKNLFSPFTEAQHNILPAMNKKKTFIYADIRVEFVCCFVYTGYQIALNILVALMATIERYSSWFTGEVSNSVVAWSVQLIHSLAYTFKRSVVFVCILLTKCTIYVKMVTMMCVCVCVRQLDFNRMRWTNEQCDSRIVERWRFLYKIHIVHFLRFSRKHYQI